MSKLEISFDKVDVHFFVPEDLETFEEYFAADGPERPASFFFAHHAKLLAAEEMTEVPSPGDSIMLEGEEFMVRVRLFSHDDKKNRAVAVLLTPPSDVDKSEVS